ncbi:MAG: hypothetical protein GY870_18160 [archaeon]|nr:hypothetical protein [archaeon]
MSEEERLVSLLKRRMLEIRKEIGGSEFSEEDYNNDNYSNGYVEHTPEVLELLKENLFKIKEEIENEHTEFEELYRLKQILEEYNEKLTDSLRISRKQNESLNIKISQMNQQKRDIESKEREMDLLVRELQQNSNEKDSKLSDIEKENFLLTQKNSELTQENLEISSENHELQKRLEESEDEFFSLNEKNLKLNQDLEKKEEEYNALYDRVKIIEERIDEREGDDVLSTLEEENMILGEGLVAIEKNLLDFKGSVQKFFLFVKGDLPKKSIYKVFFALVDNPVLRIKDIKPITNITIPTIYSDIKILEKMGLLHVKRDSGKRYSEYIVSLIANEE